MSSRAQYHDGWGQTSSEPRKKCTQKAIENLPCRPSTVNPWLWAWSCPIINYGLVCSLCPSPSFIPTCSVLGGGVWERQTSLEEIVKLGRSPWGAGWLYQKTWKKLVVQGLTFCLCTWGISKGSQETCSHQELHGQHWRDGRCSFQTMWNTFLLSKLPSLQS